MVFLLRTPALGLAFFSARIGGIRHASWRTAYRNLAAKKSVAARRVSCLDTTLQPVNTPQHAFAVIDGSLCQLGRLGGRAVWHVPIASAVVEFRRGALCTYVREHPHGFLPGLANLYCLDGAHRLRWMAEWPMAEDPCAGILGEANGVLECISERGAAVRLDAATGRLIDWTVPVAATA